MFERLIARLRNLRKAPDAKTAHYMGGGEGAQELLEMYERHGPLDMLVEADAAFELWPKGRILKGVKINNVTLLQYSISLDVEWDSDRAIRTGLARRIFGP